MALEKFHYKTPHGEIVATKFKNLPIGLVRKMRHAQGDAVFSMVEEALDEEALAVFDKLSLDEFAAFQAAWTADSGISVGESSASSKS